MATQKFIDKPWPCVPLPSQQMSDFNDKSTQ
jgi:hypothetical protein